MKEIKSKKLQFSCLNNDTMPDIPVLCEQKNNKGWITYGKDNKYPDYLWNLYLRSSLLESIINGTADFVFGNGIVNNTGDERKYINHNYETLDDIIKRINIDYLIFDGFALQLTFDLVGEVTNVFWLDFRKCRVNEDGTKVMYSNEWEKAAPKYVEYDVFDGKDRTGSKVLYFKGHKTRGYYPIPRYSGALNAIETSVEIARYHLNSIHNNFNGNLIISFNNGEPDDETKKDIEKKIKNKFAGADNGGSFMIVYNDSKENAVTVDRLQDDNTDKKYEMLRKDTYKEIFIAFRCQPQLFGFVIEGNLFNKEEYEQAFQLYYKTVVVPIQDDIIRCFDKIYRKENSIEFIPFQIENPQINIEENERTANQ